jgi:PAS domain S-box-containing protein
MLRKTLDAARPGRHAPRSCGLDLGVLLRDTAAGVCAVDAEGRVALWNRSAEHIVGYTAREVVGRLCCQIFVGGDGAGAPLCYNGCHVETAGDRSASSRRFALMTRTKAGAPVRLVVDALLVPDARGECSAVVHLFRDDDDVTREVRRALADGTAALEAALTPREREIFRLVATGANTRVIAAELRVSPATVRNHVQNLLGKLGVHSRLEAVAYALRHWVFAGDPGKG